MSRSENYRVERGVVVKAERLHPNPWNPYANKSDLLQEAIGDAIAEFDQLIDLVVRPHPEIEGDYQILDGEGRHRTFQPDDDVRVCIVHGLSDAEAKKITLVMDETRATADKIDLAVLLQDIAGDIGQEELGKGLPFSSDDLNEIIDLASVNWDQFESPDDEDDSEEDDAQPDTQGEAWVYINAKVTESAYAQILALRDRINQDTPLDEDDAMAWGQVLLNLSIQDTNNAA